MTDCPFCGLRYVDDIAEDHLQHRRRHQAAIPWRRRYPWVEFNYHAREYWKGVGWRLFHGASKMEDHVQGAEVVLRMHFSRSVDHSLPNGDHPFFEVYAAAYLAQPNVARLLGESILAALLHRYRIEPDPSTCLPDGFTSWVGPRIPEDRIARWRASEAEVAKLVQSLRQQLTACNSEKSS